MMYRQNISIGNLEIFENDSGRRDERPIVILFTGNWTLGHFELIDTEEHMRGRDCQMERNNKR